MAAVNVIAGLSEFNPKKCKWEEWCEILSHVFVANDVTDEGKQKSILLASCGTETYQLIRALVQPARPDQKSFAELVAVLKDHFTPLPSEIVQRFKFHSRNRKQGESVASYVAELRRLSEGCNFGTSLQSMLRDRVVCGIADDNMQKKLLAESALTFTSALKIITAMEAADKNLQDIHGEKSVQVCSIQKKPAKSGKEQKTNSDVRKACYRCGKTNHVPDNCFYKSEKCHKCGKIGHISKVCRSASNKGTQHKGGKSSKMMTNKIHCVSQQDGTVEDLFEDSMFHVTTQGKDYPDPYFITVDVNGQSVVFEVDTGSPVTIVNENTANRIGITSTGSNSHVSLKSYTGQVVELQGTATVTVTYQDRSHTLQISIAKGNGPNLLGRSWIYPLNFDIRDISINCVSPESTPVLLQNILNKHASVFKDELGTLQGFQAHINVDPTATPKFYKPRPVPYALRPKIEVELDRMLKEKIIEPVKYSEWACPIVPVLKPSGTVRICGDFKLTVNRVSTLEHYPIPTLEDLCTKLSGGEKFTKLDMSHAYQQLVLDEESRKYVVINTHKGLFRYTRLPFGVSSSPAIFQRMIESMLQGLNKAAGYLDDVINSGRDDREHLKVLDNVLQRLSDAGLRLRREKCVFMAEEVQYLGYRLDKEGLHPVEKKLDAIQNARVPQDVRELRAYLGLLNYYHRFLPNLPDTLSTLYRLLQKDVKWTWGKREQGAFDKSKTLLQSSDVLVHFDSSKQLLLQCDASPYGVGVVLAHRMDDGTERPISFASRTLTKAEQNYSQLDREGLSIIYGLRKFHKYVYGRHFVIITDHKPLISLFNENNAVPQMVSPRVQRWAVLLRAYDYKIHHKKGSQHNNADALSRLPSPNTEKTEKEDMVLLLSELDTLPITAADVRADFAGPFMGHSFLIIVDAYSKWIECMRVTSLTASTTITHLRRLFAAYGLPETIVTDNATTFVGEEFAMFMSKNGIEHVTSSPYHPAGNGLAERSVQTVKDGLKKTEGDSVDTKLQRLLFAYRLTPQSTTGMSPSFLFIGRRLRSRLDLVFPDMQARVKKSQRKVSEKVKSPGRLFQVHDTVWIRNFGAGPKWIGGTIESVSGPLSYVVQLADGRLVRRHVDHVRSRATDIPVNSNSSNMVPPEPVPTSDISVDVPVSEVFDTTTSDEVETSTSASTTMSQPTSPAATAVPELRRSTRIRQPPDYYQSSM